MHDRTRRAFAILAAAGRTIHRLTHDLVIIITAMWVTVVAILLVFDNTGILATISQTMPTDSGSGERRWIDAADDIQVLSGLLVALPALLVLLIAAGALRRPMSRK